MLANIINSIAVIFGSLIGIFFKRSINTKITDALVTALALVVAVLGIMGAIETADSLGMVICMALGTLIGELLDLDGKLTRLAELLKRLVAPKETGESSGNFTQGFISATLTFCIGSMAIMGAMQAGISGDMSIILSKSVIDCVTAVSFATALGIGVAFSALPVLVYQGTMTLLASVVAPFLSQPVINEISAVGSLMMIGIAINLLNLGKEIKVANMLPAMFLPVIYQPLSQWIGQLIG